MIITSTKTTLFIFFIFLIYISSAKPTLTEINEVPLNGGWITIKGTELIGSTIDGSPVLLTVNIGTTSCNDPSNLIFGDFKAIRCKLSPINSNETIISSLKVYVYIGGVLVTSTLTFNYTLPKINSVVDQGNGQLLITGISLNDVTVIFNNQEFFTINSTSSTIEFPINTNFKNGDIYVKSTTIKSIQSNLYFVKFKPIISEITYQNLESLKQIGGVITITGSFLNLKTFTLQSTNFKAINENSAPICSDFVEITTGSKILCTLISSSGNYLKVIADSLESNQISIFLEPTSPTSPTISPSTGKDETPEPILNPVQSSGNNNSLSKYSLLAIILMAIVLLIGFIAVGLFCTYRKCILPRRQEKIKKLDERSNNNVINGCETEGATLDEITKKDNNNNNDDMVSIQIGDNIDIDYD